MKIVPVGEDWNVFCEVRRQSWAAQAWTPDEFVRERDVLAPEQRTLGWLAVEGEGPVACASLSRDLGSYHPQRWMVDVAVHPSHRRRGLGRALYDHLLAFVLPQDPQELRTRVREDEPDSIAFAMSRGYQETKRDFESLLKLDQVNTAYLERCLATEIPASVRLCALAELTDMESFHRCFEEVRHDVPRAHAPTPMDYETFRQLVLEDGYVDFEASVVAMEEDRCVGICYGFRGEAEGRFDQGLTGVVRELRSRGLAARLKAEALLRVRAAGYREIYTDNDSRNVAMLRINDQLGFVRQVGVLSMQWVPA